MNIMNLNKMLALLLGLAVLLPTSATFAFPAIPATETTTTTFNTITVPSSATTGVDNGYGGLKWTLDGGLAPEVVVGYRHAQVDTNGDTQGGDISFSFKVFGGLQPGKIRVKYFNGKEYLQGEVGAGYDFAKGAFAGISAQGPYSNAGVDYHFSASSPLEPYLLLNSLGIYNKPQGHTTIITPTTTTTLSCPPGSTLNGNFCLPPLPD
jgi:hypothetical protein